MSARSLSPAFPLIPAAILALGVAAALVPDKALADDSLSSASSSSFESASVEIEEGETYKDVVNAQVAGDFFFVLCVDTALLAMNLGALGFLCFRSR